MLGQVEIQQIGQPKRMSRLPAGLNWFSGSGLHLSLQCLLQTFTEEICSGRVIQTKTVSLYNSITIRYY